MTYWLVREAALYGFTTLLALVAPNLMCKPPTILYNKVTIKDARQAVQMFGPDEENSPIDFVIENKKPCCPHMAPSGHKERLV